MDTEEAFTGSRSVTINVTGQSTKQEIDINKKYSSDNYLKELSIDGYELSPAFNKDTLEYTVSLDYDVEKINVIGKANDTKANVKGLGEINVNVPIPNIVSFKYRPVLPFLIFKSMFFNLPSLM